MTKQEKNALGKVNAVLQVLGFILQSVLVTLITYAPNQTQLIDILDYVANVIKALLASKPLPDIPVVMLPQGDPQGDNYSNESTRHFVIGEDNAPLIFEPREYGVVSESLANVDIPLLQIENAPLEPFSQPELYPTKPISKQEDVKNDAERFKGTDPDCPRTV